MARKPRIEVPGGLYHIISRGNNRRNQKTAEGGVRPDFVDISSSACAAAKASGLSRQELCSKSKNRVTVAVRDAVIILGRERGISNRELAEALGIDGSSVTKRVDVACVRGVKSVELKRLRKAVRKKARMKKR